MTLSTARFFISDAAYVNEANHCAPNALFQQIGGRSLGNLPAGQVVEVLDGPFDTVNGIVYWKVYSPLLKKVGFTPEGRPAQNDYWLDPVPTFQTFHVVHRLTPGARAFVETKTGKSNNLREWAGLTAPIVASVPPGAIVTLDGSAPFLNGQDDWLWWYVTVNGQQGWMAEVNNGVYNLLPLTVAVQCA
ncbi:MAG: hypothetical protein ABTQ73_08495 [Caldilineales bacterium]